MWSVRFPASIPVHVPSAILARLCRQARCVARSHVRKAERANGTQLYSISVQESEKRDNGVQVRKHLEERRGEEGKESSKERRKRTCVRERVSRFLIRSVSSTIHEGVIIARRTKLFCSGLRCQMSWKVFAFPPPPRHKELV